MSLKVDLFKALVTPFLQEVGKRTGEVLGNKVYGKKDNPKDKKKEAVPDTKKEKPDANKSNNRSRTN